MQPERSHQGHGMASWGVGNISILHQLAQSRCSGVLSSRELIYTKRGAMLAIAIATILDIGTAQPKSPPHKSLTLPSPFSLSPYLPSPPETSPRKGVPFRIFLKAGRFFFSSSPGVVCDIFNFDRDKLLLG